MLHQSRRSFLKTSSAVALTVAASQSRWLYGSPLGLPVGLQLYCVRELLAKDFLGTLHMVSSLGYQEVEAAGFYVRGIRLAGTAPIEQSPADVKPAELKKALKDAGLSMAGAHFDGAQMFTQTDEIIGLARELGLKYIVCATPQFQDPARVKDIPRRELQNAYTLEDWKWNAEQFNQMGAKAKAAGMDFLYHNHVFECRPLSSGELPIDILINSTDPAKSNFELDCGWMFAGGLDSAEYLKRYPTRFRALHVKDFKTAKSTVEGRPPTATELGLGVMDYGPIFAAANKAYVKYIYVEQEGFDMPVNDSLKMDAEYVKKFKA
jgi:sugar phosphate isomerase/epimerase